MPRINLLPWREEGDPEYVFPLLSQPLQELCLRIPTYVLTYGARDRGLARMAFRADVPLEILKRRTKGFIDEYTKAVFDSNLTFMKDLLLDGVLVKERLIDVEKLNLALAGDFTKGLGHAIDIMSLSATEAWVRNWTTPRSRMAA